MTARSTRLRETFDALEAIGWRLQLSLTEDGRYFPITPHSASSRDPDTVRALDAFLQRFNQALDHVLRKLFPRLQAAISADDELLPVTALFEALHRAGVIESVEEWRELIEVRNRLTHDYALDAVERADVLNDAWSRAPALLEQLGRAESYVRRHELIEGEGR